MRRVSLASAAILIVLAVIVFAPAPGDTLWMRRLHNFAHGPAFGCIAVLLLVGLRRLPGVSRLPTPADYALAFAVAALLGVASEAGQMLSGRDPSWIDVRHDVLGAAAFLLIFAAFDARCRSRVRAPRWLAIASGLAILVWLASPVAYAAFKYRERSAMFPVLADFSRSADFYFIWRQHVLVEFAPLPDALSRAPGESAARVRFLPTHYAGVNFHEPEPDWRGFETLALELANPDERDIELVLRVDDAHHNNEYQDRYNHAFVLRAGERRVVRFPLAQVERAPRGRRMDMSRIAGVVLFRAEPSAAQDVYVMRMWLER